MPPVGTNSSHTETLTNVPVVAALTHTGIQAQRNLPRLGSSHDELHNLQRLDAHQQPTNPGHSPR